jgi:hypothetical protein
MATTLTIPYTGPASILLSPWLRLEQEPVDTTRLSLSDLQTMLAMAINGVPAQVYTAPSCPASVRAGGVVVPLTVWVWPSALDLPYRLTAALGVVGEPIRIEQEREFDLVIDFASVVDLPFIVADVDWEWSDLPCFDRFGAEVPRPDLTCDALSIRSSGAFLGVVRIRCRAIGYQHTVTMTLDKAADKKMADIKNSATVAWVDGEGTTVTESLELTIPGCVKELMAACPDGQLVQEATYGSITDEELVPVVYYNDCSGQILAVRYEPA